MHMILRIVLSVAVFLIWHKLYRFYKNIGRRCPKCGEWRKHKNHRRHKIIMASDEMISTRSPAGKLRFWIRRIEKRTFSHCRSCDHIVLVKIDLGPMSILHAKWVELTDKEQFFSDPVLDHVYDELVRKLWGSRIHDSKYSYKDNPPLIFPLGLFPDMDMKDSTERFKKPPQ